MPNTLAPTSSEDQPYTDDGQENTDRTQLARAGGGQDMREKTCSLWMERADYRCIPTTGATNADGTAVMDSGLALEADRRFEGLAADLGRLLTARGNHVHVLRPGLLSFPTQQFVWSGPSLQVITRSVRELIAIVGDHVTLLPNPISSEDDAAAEGVARILATLPDNIIVVRHTL